MPATRPTQILSPGRSVPLRQANGKVEEINLRLNMRALLVLEKVHGGVTQGIQAASVLAARDDPKRIAALVGYLCILRQDIDFDTWVDGLDVSTSDAVDALCTVVLSVLDEGLPPADEDNPDPKARVSSSHGKGSTRSRPSTATAAMSSSGK